VARPAHACLGSAGLVLALACATANAATPEPAAPLAAIAMAGGKSVGTLGAGLACLPKGKLKRSDFVADPAEMQQDLRDAMAALDPAKRAALSQGGTAPLSIELREISTRLCNKTYGVFGMGDTRSLSGEARFVFGWLSGGSPAGEAATVEIVLAPGKRDGATPRTLFREALARLLERLASPSAAR
jgi:hypothetical protein